jgi:hypothetical protein
MDSEGPVVILMEGGAPQVHGANKGPICREECSPPLLGPLSFRAWGLTWSKRLVSVLINSLPNGKASLFGLAKNGAFE